MLAPLRGAMAGVMAVQQSHCDSEDMAMSISAAGPMSGHDMSNMSSDKPVTSDMHAAHMQSVIDTQSEPSTSEHQCCCCDSGCVSNCDMGVSASMVISASEYSPVFVNTSNSISYTSAVLVRALAPPPRPPSNHS